MMEETYAPNAIIIGVLFGLIVTLKTNIILGVITGVVISIFGWILIRAFEKTLERGVNSAVDAVSKKFKDYMDGKR